MDSRLLLDSFSEFVSLSTEVLKTLNNVQLIFVFYFYLLNLQTAPPHTFFFSFNLYRKFKRYITIRVPTW